MVTRPEPAVPEPYRAYAQVALEAESESMSSHGSQGLAIEHFESKQRPVGPIHYLSEKELSIPLFYLEV
jgi:hypothetical protein